jgi:hypothetical protein
MASGSTLGVSVSRYVSELTTAPTDIGPLVSEFAVNFPSDPADVRKGRMLITVLHDATGNLLLGPQLSDFVATLHNGNQTTDFFI